MGEGGVMDKIFGYLTNIERPIRFFCRLCGKELFELADYEKNFYRHLTMEYLIAKCECSDCILQQIIDIDKEVGNG